MNLKKRKVLYDSMALGTMIMLDHGNMVILRKKIRGGISTVEWVGLIGGVACMVSVVAAALKGDVANLVKESVMKAIKQAFGG